MFETNNIIISPDYDRHRTVHAGEREGYTQGTSHTTSAQSVSCIRTYPDDHLGIRCLSHVRHYVAGGGLLVTQFLAFLQHLQVKPDLSMHTNIITTISA